MLPLVTFALYRQCKTLQGTNTKQHYIRPCKQTLVLTAALQPGQHQRGPPRTRVNPPFPWKVSHVPWRLLPPNALHSFYVCFSQPQTWLLYFPDDILYGFNLLPSLEAISFPSEMKRSAGNGVNLNHSRSALPCHL